MLTALSIRDVVLIEWLELDFTKGLTALTGETGAGKSILLDSLGLVLGGRSDVDLIREGASQATVTAIFSMSDRHPIRLWLSDQSVSQAEGAEDIVFRRTVARDGRSRAFINDQAVSIGFLREAGAQLVEIQGQFDQRGLLDPGAHRTILDRFADLKPQILQVSQAWQAYQAANTALRNAQVEANQAQADEVWLRHAVEELDRFGLEPEEEDRLSASRAVFMNAEKLIVAIQSALGDLSGEMGAEGSLSRALRGLARIAKLSEGTLDKALIALEKAENGVAEAESLLQNLLSELDMDPKRQAEIDERLFALRDLARKHQVGSKDLILVRENLTKRLQQLDQKTEVISQLTKAATETAATYKKVALDLSAARKRAAQALDKAVLSELLPLRMEKARFKATIETLAEQDWGELGIDRVRFDISTNPGQPLGPLTKIASGGELSRFLLAIKVALKKADPVPTLIFDEVDAGIGGATADAVGERLQKLAEDVQILVVTHSPQVAACAHNHWTIHKEIQKDRALTRATQLDLHKRKDEIARMLSGASVTIEAQAAAARLLERETPKQKRSKAS